MPTEQLHPRAETISFFLPPDSTPSDIYCKLYGQGPYINTSTLQQTVETAQMFDTKAKLRGVLLSYSILNPKKDPNDDIYNIVDSTQFCHHEVPVKTFLDLVHCCSPKAPETLKSTNDVRNCWNRVFPGSISPYNYINMHQRM